MIKPLIAVLCLVVSTAWAGDITLHQGSQPTQQIQSTRLGDLVSLPSLSNTWWPGAVISYQPATAEQELQRQKTLNQLAILAADRGGDEGDALNALRQQLSAVKVTGRQLVNLDPDWVRVHPRSNVALEGQYQLWANPQPDQVWVMGLVSRPGKQLFVAGRTVSEYLDNQERLEGGDRSYAWIVYPDGRTQKAPIAYWNRRHVELMPGSVLYLGLAGQRFSGTNDEINRHILNALTHRIPD